MALIDMKDYNRVAKIYWWSVTVLGFLALGYAVSRIVQVPADVLVQILIGATIAAVVGLFPVRIPGAKTAIAGAEIFIFLTLLLYGAEAAVLVAAVEGLAASWRASRRWTSRIGTPAMASLAMIVCATLFTQVRGTIHANGASSTILLLTLIGFAALYFAANIFLTSTLISLKNGSPIAPVTWLRNFFWIGLAYVTCASIAGLLFFAFERFGLPVLLVAVPMIAMFLSTLHSYFERRESDERHVEELKASESRFHSAFTHAAIGMSLVGVDGRFIQANKSFCEMLGRSNQDLGGCGG
jgi:PAS domain-containing protein